MPIYEYRCNECGEESSLMQKVGETSSACKSCNGTLSRVVSSSKRPCLNDLNVIKEKISKDADRIRQKLRNGDSNTIDDICGEA